MKMLIARVGGRIAQRNMNSDEQQEAEFLPGFDQRLESVLNMT